MKNIRKIEFKDKYPLQQICLTTANGIFKYFKKVLFLLFCDYYVENESDNSYCVEINNKLLGYIFCSPNYDKYFKIYKKKYLKKLYITNFIFGIIKSIDLIIEKKYANQFSAHLHIDLLPEIQHLGYGTKLMNTLLNQLKNDGINGVFLIADKKNIKANKFYKKCGFNLIESKFYGNVYGYKLN